MSTGALLDRRSDSVKAKVAKARDRDEQTRSNSWDTDQWSGELDVAAVVEAPLISTAADKTLDAADTTSLKACVLPLLGGVPGESCRVGEREPNLSALFPCLGVDEIAPSYAIVKRGIDILGAIVGLALSSPIWLGLWLKNTVDRSGPVLYAHTRVGKGGKPFQCYKFRTMVADADRLKPNLREFNQHEDHRTFKMANDPRITPVGKWLRKLSIDEMPQFLNVLKGDMSLVGPRPPIPSELKYYGEEDFCRLGVTPGLTCIWQVSGRSDLPFVEQLVMDIQYIENRSLWLDLQLIARTLPAICSCRGAR